MSLLFNKDDILLINRRLAALIGLNEAIVVQQIHYWIKKKSGGIEHQGCRWVFNSLDRWHEQFPFWSADTVKRALAALKSRGLIRVEKLAEIGRDRTNYYTIDYQQVALLEAGKLPQCKDAACTDGSGHFALMDKGNLHQSISADCPDANKTKTTTKTTTETTSPTAVQPAAYVVVAAEKPIVEKDTALQTACKATWSAYSGEYTRKYGAAPVRNAKVNANVKAFVQRIGHDEAPGVAAFFVNRVSEAFVVRKMHEFGLLLASAESYRTQWATNQSMTATRAGQIDKTQSNFDAAGEAMAILRAKREMNHAG